MSPKRLKEVTTVKVISNESGGSAGARTIAMIATEMRLLFETLD